MDNFDKEIKQLAKQEKVNVPNEYNERIDILLNNINTNVKRTKKRTSMKVLLAAAVLTVLTTATVFAAPVISDMAGGVISYFNAPSEFRYLSQKADFEKFNSKVGASAEDSGFKLTIDNIAVDDNYINVFYTITGKSPIKLAGDKNNPDNWRVNWTAPVFSFKADGRYITPQAQNDIDARMDNENTISGMQRFCITKVLPDKFELEIYSDDIANVEGKWYIPLVVDKSAVKVESLTVIPSIKATITSGIKEKYTHNISIDKVSVSPFGSQIVITEKVKNDNTFDDFALMSDKGKYLPIIPSAMYGGNDIITTKVTNSFEFMGGTLDMKSIKLIPFSIGSDDDGTPTPQLISNPISDKLPMTFKQSANGSIVIDDIKITKEAAKITFHTEGVVAFPTASVALLDENGEHLKMELFLDDTYDRQTSKTTISYSFKGASEQDIAKIKKIGIHTQTVELNEADAITIPLK